MDPLASPKFVYMKNHMSISSQSRNYHILSVAEGNFGLGGETRTRSLRAPDAAVYQLTLHPDDLVRMGRFELPAIRVTAFSTLPVYQFPAHPHIS